MSQVDLPQVSLQRYVDLVRRRRWQLLPISLLGLFVGGVVAFFIPRYYVSETLLVHQAVPGEEQRGTEDPFRVIVDSARVSIPLAVRKAAEAMKWDEAMAGDAHARAQFDKDLMSRVLVMDSNAEQKRPYALIRVFFRDRDGKRAASFLTALTKTWMQNRIEELRKPASERRKKAKDEAADWDRTWNRLRDDKRQLEQQYQIEPGVEPSIQRASYLARQKEAKDLQLRLQELEIALVRSDLAIQQLQAQLAALPPRVPPAVQHLEALAEKSPLTKLLWLQIEAKRREVEGTWVEGTPRYAMEKRTLDKWEERLRMLLTPEQQDGDGTVPNPDYVAKRKELDEKSGAHEVLVAEAKQKRETVAAERQRAEELVVAIDDYERKLAQLKEAEEKRKAANLERDRAEELLARLDSQVPVTTLQEATVPPRPTEPNILLVALVGCVLGLGAAIGLILLLDVLQGTFKTVEDVERGLSVPVLGGMSHLETEEELRRAVRVRRRNSLVAVAFFGLGGFVLLIFLVDPTRLPSFVRDVLAFLLGRGR